MIKKLGELLKEKKLIDDARLQLLARTARAPHARTEMSHV
jgi:hypothetical protein